MLSQLHAADCQVGSAIVLDPPTSGWSALVWVLPIVGGLAAAAGLAVVLVRRGRSDGRDLDADVRGGPVDPAVLEERRRFLTQSLSDADAEYLAGDLSDADYLRLRQRDLARLATLGPGTATGRDTAAATAMTTTATDTLPRADVPSGTGVVDPTRPDPRSRRGRNRWFLTVAVGCFAAALVVAVPVFTSNRLPGQTATGSVSLSPAQQLTRSLDQAATVENQGQLGLAAQLYQSILSAHPYNEAARAQIGWLEFRIGRQGSSATLVADARAKLNRAAALAPRDYAVHLYLGTLLLQQDGNATGAVDQFRMFLADGPPATVLSQAASTLRAAFTQAGQPVPAGVPAA